MAKIVGATDHPQATDVDIETLAAKKTRIKE